MNEWLGFLGHVGWPIKTWRHHLTPQKTVLLVKESFQGCLKIQVIYCDWTVMCPIVPNPCGHILYLRNVGDGWKVTIYHSIRHSPSSLVDRNVSLLVPCVFTQTHNIHVWYPYIYHKNQPNVGKYTIHGCYGKQTRWRSVLHFYHLELGYAYFGTPNRPPATHNTPIFESLEAWEFCMVPDSGQRNL